MIIQGNRGGVKKHTICLTNVPADAHGYEIVKLMYCMNKICALIESWLDDRTSTDTEFMSRTKDTIFFKKSKNMIVCPTKSTLLLIPVAANGNAIVITHPNDSD